MIIHEVEQGSRDWLKLKCDKFTASNAINLFSKPSTQAYQDLINGVVAGKVYGIIQEPYKSAAMEWGNTYEPEAREFYAYNHIFRPVKEVGFIELNEFVGMSPDGLVGDDGLVEIKCPQLNTHLGYLISEKIPNKYYWQMQFQMLVSGRKWNDFISYYPIIEPDYIEVKPFIQRVERNAEDIAKLKEALKVAIELAKERINKLKAA